jgi:hypothetical protein
MDPALKKFIVYSLVAGIVLLFGAWPLLVFTDYQVDISPVFFVVPFVLVITIVFHYYLLQAAKGEPKAFIGKFMASSGIKLMIYLAVIVFYVIWHPQNSTVFLTAFLISYIVFTFIEVVFILSHLKK